MNPLPLILFGVTYLGLLVGRLPGLALDRPGIALLGALGFLLTGLIDIPAARGAVHMPTILVLFGLMLLSVQYEISGLYGWIGHRVARAGTPRRLLAGTVVVAAGLSAVLTNDVVCFALAPLLCTTLLRARRDPVPYLLALMCASNIGSALTPIGNPQNILLAQRMSLPFAPFVAACVLPVLASLGFLYWCLSRRLDSDGQWDAIPVPPPSPPPRVDRFEAGKALVLTAVGMVLFVSPVPAHFTALGIAGVVLTSRKMQTREMLGLVDWPLLVLFCGLFVVVKGFETSGWMGAGRQALENAVGRYSAAPLVLVLEVSVLSLLVGNVPAVMLAIPFVEHTAVAGHLTALASTFAGNASLAASVANLIVAEQAARAGVRIDFPATWPRACR